MKITKTMQKVAVDILTEFMFVLDMHDVDDAFNKVFEKYGLCDDPFTGLPCTPDEYCKNRLEYERQTMIDRYGYCDGLD
jgi:hypothetical protein